MLASPMETGGFQLLNQLGIKAFFGTVSSKPSSVSDRVKVLMTMASLATDEHSLPLWVYPGTGIPFSRYCFSQLYSVASEMASSAATNATLRLWCSNLFSGRIPYVLQSNVAYDFHAALSRFDLYDIAKRTTRLTEMRGGFLYVKNKASVMAADSAALSVIGIT